MTEPDAIDQGADGRERILAVAAQVLENQGEAALRVAEIAEMADVALGLISYHFGGRDGLIVAAQQRRFTGLVRDDAVVFKRAVDNAPDRAALLRTL